MKKIILSIYLIVSVIIAFSVYKDYGISWDEGMQRRTAQINFDYIFNDGKELDTWVDRDYGVAFELPLYILEKTFKWEKPNGDEQYVYIYRHLFTHFFYLIGGFFLFLLVSKLFNSDLYGILALFMYVLNPRIYAHSFINSKDIPLMVVFIICFYFAYVFIKKRTILNAILVGFFSAVLIDTRILGIIFPTIFIGYLLFFDLIEGGFIKWKHEFKYYLSIIVATLIFTYLFWPILWHNPIENFIQIFKNMSYFRNNQLELVCGEYIRASEDKSYFFKWFFTTNPLGYLILGCLGFLLLIRSIIKNKMYFFKSEENKTIFLIALFFIIPLVIIILRNSVLYNGWRQLFFLYPSFIIVGIYTLNNFKKNKYNFLIISMFTVYLIKIYTNQNTLHPYETVYFNELVSREQDYIAKNYELDYWGHSYKEALENLLIINTSDSVINVMTSEYVGEMNSKILSPKEKNRIHFVKDINLADYFISNFYTDDQKLKSNELVFQVRKNNSPIISIFKLK